MRRSQILTTFVALFVMTGIAFAEWTEFKSDKYGFSMQVPAKGEGVAKDFGDGWGGLAWEEGSTQLYGVAKLGAGETPEAIREFGVKATGIPAADWHQEAKGTDTQGFKWFEAYSAEGEGKIMAAYLGVGPKGSYLLYVMTTPEEYEAHKAAFEKWQGSIHAH